jgi:hypothetical protein
MSIKSHSSPLARRMCLGCRRRLSGDPVPFLCHRREEAGHWKPISLNRRANLDTSLGTPESLQASGLLADRLPARRGPFPNAGPCEQRTCPSRARLDQPASEGSTCATIST